MLPEKPVVRTSHCPGGHSSMDQNLRGSHRPASDPVEEDMTSEPEDDKPGHGSAMVLVLGFVALISMVFGFLLGLLF